jgi:hypothetical protein
MPKIYVGKIGLEIRAEIGQSLSGATSMKILVQKPDGEEVEWVAAQYNSTTIYYVTVDGDLDEAGIYRYHAYVEWGAASVHVGEMLKLKVYELYT